jgi:hypothetical protein
MGSLYRQKGSRFWWMKYYAGGVPIRESTGVPERVAMTITGHKTRAVFDRYHIVSPGDLEAAARKLAGIVSGIATLQQVDAGFVSV